MKTLFIFETGDTRIVLSEKPDKEKVWELISDLIDGGQKIGEVFLLIEVEVINRSVGFTGDHLPQGAKPKVFDLR